MTEIQRVGYNEILMAVIYGNSKDYLDKAQAPIVSLFLNLF